MKEIKTKRFSGIRTKIMTVFVAVVVLNGAAMILFMPVQLEKSYSAQALRHVQSVADMAAFTVSPAMVFRDTAACDEALLPLRQNRDLLFVIVRDDSGRTFYSFTRTLISAPSTSAQRSPSRPDSSALLTARSPVLHASHLYGTVDVGYSRDQVNEALSTMRSTVGLEVVLFLLVGIVSVLVVSLFVTHPLHRMVKTVQAIALGNMGERVQVTTNDEVGLLGRRFNEMVDTLQGTQEELRQLNRDLERRVTDRTLELEREILERRKSDEQLKLSLREKEVLLKEIHHRVKNNLQVISSMLSLQRNTIEDQAVREILRVSQGRVRSMATIHELLYRSEDFAHIDFAGYVQTLASQLFRSYAVSQTDVQLKLEIRPLSFSIDTAIPCGLIINELISNALKYAFPDGRQGIIRVVLEACPEAADVDTHSDAEPARKSSLPKVCLTVSDDGIGLPLNVNPSKSSTLGLMLVTTLADQLNGTLEVRRGQGTAFKISF